MGHLYIKHFIITFCFCNLTSYGCFSTAAPEAKTGGRTGGPAEEDAAGDLGARAPEALRLQEEVHHLQQLLLQAWVMAQCQHQGNALHAGLARGCGSPR